MVTTSWKTELTYKMQHQSINVTSIFAIQRQIYTLSEAEKNFKIDAYIKFVGNMTTVMLDKSINTDNALQPSAYYIS